ncbi:hypothetical protein ACQVRX_11305 [Ralstonia pseudosolanacearum]
MIRPLRNIPKRLAELVTDPETCRLSHTKLWPNVANLAATAIFMREGWDHRLTPEIWGVYLAAVGGYTVLMRLATRKAKPDA